MTAMAVPVNALGSRRFGSARRRRWVLLVAALLVAWQTSGLLHALSHLSDAGAADGPALPQHAVCTQCLMHAGSDGLLGAAHAAPDLPPPPAVLATRVVRTPLTPRLELPYQVRAPPVAERA